MTAPALEDLKRIIAADVYKDGVPAGTLTRDDQGAVTFRYLEGYAGDPVASTLPVGQDPVTAAGGGLPSFFSGLLPEGHRLTVLRRAAKTSADDELTLLLAVGTDAPGDVQVIPAGERLHTEAPVATDDPQTLDFAALAGVPDRNALPGIQSKASASMVNVPVHLQGHSALLKLDPPNHPYLVVNEALHLRHAAALGISVSEHSVVHDRHGRAGLLVRRFDRVADRNGETRRLAMEDAGQALGIYPAQKYNVTTEDVINTLAGLTPHRLTAVRNLYLQFLYAWLTGNGDLHAKNVSVLQFSSGRWSIAPVYDVPCTALYEDMTMALSVDGRTKNLRRRHWEALAASICLPPRAARSAMTVAMTAAANVDLSVLPFTSSPLTGAERELRHRRYELES